MPYKLDPNIPSYGLKFLIQNTLGIKPRSAPLRPQSFKFPNNLTTKYLYILGCCPNYSILIPNSIEDIPESYNSLFNIDNNLLYFFTKINKPESKEDILPLKQSLEAQLSPEQKEEIDENAYFKQIEPAFTLLRNKIEEYLEEEAITKSNMTVEEKVNKYIKLIFNSSPFQQELNDLLEKQE